MAIGTPQDLGGSNIAATATTATVALTTSVQADIGDTIIVVVGSGSGAGRVLSTVTDNAPGGSNTYAIDVTSNDGTNIENLYICSARVTQTLPSGSVITATFASSLSSVRGIAAIRVSGISVSPLDRTAVGTNTTSSWNATDSSPTNQADELLISAAWNGSGTNNASAGSVKAGGSTYNEIIDLTGSSRNLVLEWFIVSAIDTYRAQGTFSASGARWRAGFASYKADTASIAPVALRNYVLVAG